MQCPTVLSFSLLVAVALFNTSSTHAFREEPSASIREQMAAISEEDVIVMQTEMAWGAEEMKRYKSLRGEWPVRSSLSSRAQTASESSLFFRGAANAQSHQGQPHHDHWNYLVSMF
jgi:hypothetical protein